MGGLGSGRRPRSDADGFVESYLRIDVRRWRREGLLEPNRRFSYCWSKKEAVADFTVNVEVRGDVVVLIYESGTQTGLGESNWSPSSCGSDLPLHRATMAGSAPGLYAPCQNAASASRFCISLAYTSGAATATRSTIGASV